MQSVGLYRRTEATLFAWWGGLACSSPGARIVQIDGIVAAVFPAPGDREVFNNAVAVRHAPPSRASVTDLAALYAQSGATPWQLWVHEADEPWGEFAAAAGLVVDTTTQVMVREIEQSDLRPPRDLDLVDEPDQRDLQDLLHEAATLAPRLRSCGAHIYAARHNGEPASCAVTFEHDGDCGIFMVETRERFRRRGLARGLVLHALMESHARGCTTASLQSTAMGEALYASAGFRPLGRYVEWQYRLQ